MESNNLRPQLTEQAYWGIGGDITKRLCVKAESDPAGVLIQLYTFIGSIVGRKVYVEVEANKLYPNLFTLLVGDSSRGRKGTSYNMVKSIFKPYFSDFVECNIKSGLFSGQGLTFHLRDEVKDAAGVVTDKGIVDKRLLVKESEFASCLNANKMDASILSTTLRDAYDSVNLTNLVKNNGHSATEPHVSIIGHITPKELLIKLNSVDIANGFANRFLFVYVERQKPIINFNDDRSELINELSFEVSKRIEHIKLNGKVQFSPEALKIWEIIYFKLSGGCSGIVGDLHARATTHITKLSLIISLLNQDRDISEKSLIAAIHLWQYCSDSVNFLYSNSLGDESLDALYSTIKEKPEGASRTDIRDLFSKNKSKLGVNQLLKSLESSGLVYSERIKTSGAPKEVWKANKDTDECTILTTKGGLLSFMS